MGTEAGLDHLRTIAVHLFSSKCNLKGMRDRKQILQLKLIIYRLKKKKTGSVFGFRITQQPTYFKSQSRKRTRLRICAGGNRAEAELVTKRNNNLGHVASGKRKLSCCLPALSTPVIFY